MSIFKNFREKLEQSKKKFKRADMSPCDNCTATHILTNQGTDATSIAEIIITFYSDRNINTKMEFKNPKVKEYYESKEKQENTNPKLRHKR